MVDTIGTCMWPTNNRKNTYTFVTENIEVNKLMLAREEFEMTLVGIDWNIGAYHAKFSSLQTAIDTLASIAGFEVIKDEKNRCYITDMRLPDQKLLDSKIGE